MIETTTPNAAAPSVAEPVKPVTLDTLTPSQLQKWRKDGSLPKPKAEAKSSEVTPTESAAVPEPAKKQETRRKPDAEARISELTRELRETQAKLDAMAKAPTKKEAEPSPAKPESKKPKLEDFSGNDAYEQWAEALADWKAEEKFTKLMADRDAASEKLRKETETQKKQDTQNEEFKTRVAKAAEKHKDFNEVAFNPELPIKAQSPVERFCLETDHGAEVLYFLGKNPAELTRINALPATQQWAALAKIELSLEKPPAKKITDAPGPASEVGGKGTAPADDLVNAVKSNDFAAYKRRANARDLKR